MVDHNRVKSLAKTERKKSTGPMAATPLVSVVIPSYNCAAYIVEALQSIFAQAYKPYEVIVVDDGSSDETQAVLAPYRERITYLYQNNRGVAAARNCGVTHARGDLIAFLDGDDVWDPQKLVRQVEAFLQFPEAGLIFTDYLKFDEAAIFQESYFANNDVFKAWFAQHNVGNRDVAYGWFFRELLQLNCIHTSSVLVRGGVMQEVGFFDESFSTCEDYDLWLRIAKKYPVLCIDRVLCGYRYRQNSLSGPVTGRSLRWTRDNLRILEKHLSNGWVPHELRKLVRTVLSKQLFAVGWSEFSQNRFREARSLLFRSLRYRLLPNKSLLYLCVSFLPFTLIGAMRWVKREWSCQARDEVLKRL